MTVKQRDACKDGFELDKIADAVFLDLPHPWDAIPHAKKSLKQGGRLCSFSPCVEQVQKAISEMRNEGFTEISTMECLLREFQARRITLGVYDHTFESAEYDEQKIKKIKLEKDEDPEENNFQNEEKTKKIKLEKDENPEENNFQKTRENDVKKNLEKSFITGIPLTTMPGHTGYLTFATLK